MSLLYFNKDDFIISKSESGDKLCVNCDGVVLVLFTAKNWPNSMQFTHEYATLPHKVNGIKFAVCELNDAEIQIAKMSLTTTTPIKDVPRFILYIKGYPQLAYTGPHTIAGIIDFLKDVIPKIQQSFINNQQKEIRQQQQQQQQQYHHEDYQENRMPTQTMSKNDEQYEISPQTRVKVYKTSYGRPYNIINENVFLEYEKAYLDQQKRH